MLASTKVEACWRRENLLFMVGETISHYKVLEKLGEGGMGVLYRAEDTRLHRLVALKFLSPELTSDPEAKRRFVHEAQAASALDHPNIGVVHEVDETQDGRAFICMAYYKGETLKQRIERDVLTIDDAIAIVLQVAEGLYRAHQAGIVHRDVKPANIILTEDRLVKLVDFGLAKLSSDTRSSGLGRHAGTAAYMSPEQIQGGTIDSRSDLFSLGIVFYEMLTGQRPFVGDHEPAIFYSTVHSNPLPPSFHRPELPRELDEVVLRLLQKEASLRYQTADALKTDLLAFVQHETVPRHETVGRSLWRSRSLMLAAGVLSAALLWKPVYRLFVPLIHLTPSQYVLVANFENHTEEPHFNNSLAEAMRVALRQSSQINLLPAERIPDALQRMRLPPDHVLDEPTALALAKREGVRVLIAGSIGQIGTSYSLTCKVIESTSGEVLDLMHREIPAVEKVLAGMDELSREIRERLGESLLQITTSAKPLDRVTTSSLPALELHSRASVLESQGKYAEASLLEEQAVQLDSTFTMAISELSYIHRKLGNDSLALAYHSRVLPLIDRVNDRERFYILSIYYGPSFEIDFPKAYQNAEQLVTHYPNSAEGYATLGWLAMHAGDTRRAIESGEKALSLDSIYAGTVFNNMGYALSFAGDADGALGYFHKSKIIRPTYYAIDSYIANALWIRKDWDAAGKTILNVLPVADIKTTILLQYQLASLYTFRGQLSQARQVCLDGLALCREKNKPAEEAYFHLLLAENAALSNNWELHTSSLISSEKLTASPYSELPLIGISYARHGRIHDASRVVRRIEAIQSGDPYFLKRLADYLHLVNGEIQLRGDNPRQAIAEFSGVQRLQSGDPLYLLSLEGIARAQALLSDTSALHSYQTILKLRGEVIMAGVRSIRNSGTWTSRLWPEIHLALAKLYAARKEDALAREHFRQSLACWSDADNTHKSSGEAKSLLNQLPAESR